MERTKGQLNGEQHVNFVEGDNWSGINKREYFAGLAMQGMLSDGAIANNKSDIAEQAVKIADALLEELSKSK